MKGIDEIQDDEFRVIGQASRNDIPGTHYRLFRIIAFAVAAVVVAAIVIFLHNRPEDGNVPVIFDQADAEQNDTGNKDVLGPLGNYSGNDTTAYTELVKKVVNDIPLDIYIPHNSKPSLSIGMPDTLDKSIVMVTQAADIRADNLEINGAFVLAGKPMAWGLSKKGFVAIINDTVTVGVAENSPLFEEATEKGGYFFRQYPLVDNGRLVENEPKGKTVRKAICDRKGEIFIVMSETPESFHDFAQAIVDMQVDNAVYLVGSVSHGFFRDESGCFSEIYERRKTAYKHENYIEWRKFE